MARWEPNARERLVEAALTLFQERGFDETAVADIAARAGLTERTFFRYFADKREVLFGGSSELEGLLVGGIAAAPSPLSPLDAVAHALEAAASFFDGRRPFAKSRQAVIAAHPALQERELIKLASLATAMAGAMRQRGTPEPAASLAAEAGMAVFKLAFARWTGDAHKRPLAQHLREALEQLKAITTGLDRVGRARPRKTERAARPRGDRSASGTG